MIVMLSVERFYFEGKLKFFYRSDPRFFEGMLLLYKFQSLQALFMDFISCLCINPYQDLSTEEI